MFEIGSEGYGLMSALTGVGAIVASLLIALREPQRLGAILPALVMGFGLLLVAFSLATYLSRPAGLIIPLCLIVVIGGAQTSYFSLSRSLMLQAAPEHLRGRVLSFLSLDRAFMTAGAAAAGFLCAAQGVQVAQIVYGIVCVVGGLAVVGLDRGFRGASALSSGTRPDRSRDRLSSRVEEGRA